MPRLGRWFVRAALLYLALGVTFGALLLAHKGMPLHPSLWRLLPAHIEFLLLGWTLQLAFGVAYWILPRFTGGVRPRPWAAALALGLLNAGVLLTGLGASLGAPAEAILAGRLLEAAAALAFVLHAWPRVKPPGA